MRYLLLIIGIFLTIGCGRPPMPPYWDQAFSPYMERFKKYTALSGRDASKLMYNLTITKSEIKDAHTLGYCEKQSLYLAEPGEYDDRVRNIVIDTAGWNNLPDSQRELLLFHELGHCVFDLTHDDTFISMPWENTVNPVYVTVHKSIMATYLLNSADYFHFRPYYLSQLFMVDESAFK